MTPASNGHKPWVCDKDEPRGADVKNSALCCTCGTLTIHRDGEGLPRHKRKAA